MLEHTEDILLEQINIKANQDSLRHYDVSVEDIDLNLYQGDLVVENFRAKPRLEILSDNSNLPPVIIKYESPEVVLKNFALSDFLLRGDILFDGFIVFAPKAKVYLTGAERDTVRRSKSPVEQLSTADFPMIRIKDVLISQAEMDLIWVPDSTLVLDIDSLNFNLRNISVDSSTINDPIPFHAEGFTLNILGFEGDFMKYHRLKTGKILYQDKTETLEIDNIHFQPKYQQSNYHQLKGFQSDWFALSVDAVRIKGFDIERFAEEHEVYIQMIEVEKPNALIQRDRNVALPPYTYKALPVSQLKNSSLDINIRQVQVNNARVEYNEQPTHDTPPGKIFFENMNVSVINVTNNSEAILTDKTMALSADASLMGDGHITLDMDFDLSKDDDRFFATGQLDTMNFASLNPLTENLLLVHLDSGIAERMQFQFLANEDSAVGRMSFAYEGLKVNMYRETRQGKFKRMDFLNSVANTFMKSKNVGKTFQEGRIFFRRKKDRYLFNYLGKCVQTGLVETVIPEGEKKLFKIDGSLIK